MKSPEKIESSPQTVAACEITIQVKGNAERLSLNDYLVGVISAEIPASFDVEAIKAQAVAARTYALKTTNYGQLPIESTTTHQAFFSEEDRKKRWQESYSHYENIIEEAVKETENEVLIYEGELITAMFHAASENYTESASNYNGSDIPYLKSVISTEKVTSEQFYTYSELNNLLQVNWTKDDYAMLQFFHNDSGRVDYMTAKGEKWTGREVREALKLKSTNFSLQYDSEGITFNVNGYGHGVGLSQYGANELAKSFTYKEILAHYYTNVEIVQYDDKFCLK